MVANYRMIGVYWEEVGWWDFQWCHLQIHITDHSELAPLPRMSLYDEQSQMTKKHLYSSLRIPLQRCLKQTNTSSKVSRITICYHHILEPVKAALNVPPALI